MFQTILFYISRLFCEGQCFLVGTLFRTIVLNTIIFLVFNKLYGIKYDDKKMYILSYLFSTLLMFVVYVFAIPEWCGVYLFIHLCVLAYALFDRKILNIVLNNAAVHVLIFLCDFVALYMSGKDYIEVTENKYNLLFCFMLCSALILHSAYRVFEAICAKGSYFLRTAMVLTVVILTYKGLQPVYHRTVSTTGGYDNLVNYLNVIFMMLMCYLAAFFFKNVKISKVKKYVSMK